MGRPREFDEQDVLARALDSFRRQGYAGTSMRDLAERTGVAASALYRTWGDKHQLFLRCLDSYAARQAQSLGEHIDADGPVIPALRAWVGSRIGGAAHMADAGCLIVNTAAELGTSDATAAARARAAWKTLTSMIESAVHTAQATGEIDEAVDAHAASEVILTAILGLRVRSRAGESMETLRTTIDSILDCATRRPVC